MSEKPRVPGPPHLAEALIRQEIDRAGPMSFSRFVDLALYHPLYGYYNQPVQRRGKGGDYFTSLQVSDIFPRIFASAILQLKETLGTEHFSLIEMGSGNGEFLEGVLTAIAEIARERKQGTWGFRTWAVERSRPARDLLYKRLSRFPRTEVVSSIDDIEWMGTLEGCIFSNEFFDALPFERWRWDGAEWREIEIALKHGEFMEQIAGRAGGPLMKEPALTPGHEIARRPFIPDIYADWGARLQRGYVLTVDYGHPRESFLSPTRANGSWLCYHKHIANKLPYQYIGDQDITAHVDFTQLVEAGKSAGFDPALFCSQGIFLTHLGQAQLETWLATATEDERRKRAGAIQQLLHPDAMGEAFWVLLQSKGVDLPPAFLAMPNRLRRVI